ncbi:MAG: hypothetical protein Q4C25_04090 [Bacillota bacterium]|nr:hypothetical protein [Bacillota bacterium]
MERNPKNTKKRRFLSWLVVLAMVMSLFAGMTGMVSAYTDDQLTVTYEGQTTYISLDTWNGLLDTPSTRVTNQQYTMASGNISRANSTHSGVKLESLIELVIELPPGNTEYNRATFENYTVTIEASDSRTLSPTVGELFGTRYTYGNGDSVTDTPAVQVETIIEDDNGTLNLIAGMTDYNKVNGKYWMEGITEITITAPSPGGDDDPTPSISGDQSWYDASKSSFTLVDEEDLIGFASLVNDGNSFKGKTVKLGNNIALTKQWNPVGNAEKQFEGTFDGNGKEISGLNVSSTDNYLGFFGHNFGTIKNFVVTGSVTNTDTRGGKTDYIGGVVGFNAGTIEKVISKVTVTAGTAKNQGSNNVGGIAGFNTSGKWVDEAAGTNKNIEGAVGLITCCGNEGSVTGYKKVGGITGENAGDIEKSYNTATIRMTVDGSGGGVGGIAGRNGNNDTAYEIGNIKDCYNTGIIAMHIGDDPTTKQGRYAGTIAGFMNAFSTVENFYGAGNIIPGYKDWGPLWARGEAEEEKLINCYSLDTLPAGSGYTTSKYTGIVKTDAEMKTAEFAEALGSEFSEDTLGINNGYPILNWQAVAEVERLIDEIPAPSALTGSDEDILKVLQAEEAYDGLSDDGKALVDNKSDLTAAQNKIAALNHTSNGVTVEGLDWNIKLYVEPIAEGPEFDAMKAQRSDKTFLGMYNITLTKFSSNGGVVVEEEYNLNGKEVTVRVVNDAFVGYEKGIVLHQLTEEADENGNYEYETLTATISGNVATFKITSTSNFGIAAEKIVAASDTSAKTGDDFNLIPLLILMILAAAAATVIVVRRKRLQ